MKVKRLTGATAELLAPVVLSTVETEPPAEGFIRTCYNLVTDAFRDNTGRKGFINSKNKVCFKFEGGEGRAHIECENGSLKKGNELSVDVGKLLYICIDSYLRRREIVIPIKEYATRLNPKAMTDKETFKNVKKKIKNAVTVLTGTVIWIKYKNGSWKTDSLMKFEYNSVAKVITGEFSPLATELLNSRKRIAGGECEPKPALLGYLPNEILPISEQNPNLFRLTGYIFKRMSNYSNQMRNCEKSFSVKSLLNARTAPADLEALKAEKLGWETRIRAKLETELNSLVEQRIIAGWDYIGGPFSTFAAWESAMIHIEPVKPLPHHKTPAAETPQRKQHRKRTE